MWQVIKTGPTLFCTLSRILMVPMRQYGRPQSHYLFPASLRLHITPYASIIPINTLGRRNARGNTSKGLVLHVVPGMHSVVWDKWSHQDSPYNSTLHCVCDGCVEVWLLVWCELNVWRDHGLCGLRGSSNHERNMVNKHKDIHTAPIIHTVLWPAFVNMHQVIKLTSHCPYLCSSVSQSSEPVARFMCTCSHYRAHDVQPCSVDNE